MRGESRYIIQIASWMKLYNRNSLIILSCLYMKDSMVYQEARINRPLWTTILAIITILQVIWHPHAFKDTQVKARLKHAKIQGSLIKFIFATVVMHLKIKDALLLNTYLESSNSKTVWWHHSRTMNEADNTAKEGVIFRF